MRGRISSYWDKTKQISRIQNRSSSLFRIISNKFFFIRNKPFTFACATWKDLRLIATTEKNAKAIVLYFFYSIHIPQLKILMLN